MQKRCRKGKSCGATCIDPRERCILDLGPLIGESTTKVVSVLQQRGSGKGGNSPAPTIDSLKSEKLREQAETNVKMTNDRIENKRKVGDQFFGKDPEGLARWNSRFAPLQNLTDAQKAAVGFYGENAKAYYKDVNQFLRTGKKTENPETDSVVKFTAQNLKEGLARLPAEPKQLERAVSGNFAQQLGNLKVGAVIEDKGFGSYTDKGSPILNSFISKTEPNAVLMVESKTARDVSRMMQYDEGEHLSMPGTKYRVVDIQPQGFYSRKTGGYVPTYTLEEV